jgi:Domain of unknown function (DUF1918)
MMQRHTELRASLGDRITIEGHRVGEHEREGEIVEVLGEEGAPPYLVRWEDGHTTEVFPSSDTHIEHVKHAG